MIELDGLTKTYDGARGIDGISFRVDPGGVLGLVGPNGAGKTTTLRCMAGIFPPDRGRVLLDGHDLATEPVRAKRSLGFVPDEPRLFDYLTVREHLRFFGRLYGVTDAEARGEALLEELDLADKQQFLPGTLSRGMRQKLAVACALLHDPRALLLDEPLTGLDPVSMRRVTRMIRRRAREGAAIIVSSHLLYLVEELCTDVLVLGRGAVIAHGCVQDLRDALPSLRGRGDLEEIFLHVTGASLPPESSR